MPGVLEQAAATPAPAAPGAQPPAAGNGATQQQDLIADQAINYIHGEKTQLDILDKLHGYPEAGVAVGVTTAELIAHIATAAMQAGHKIQAPAALGAADEIIDELVTIGLDPEIAIWDEAQVGGRDAVIQQGTQVTRQILAQANQKQPFLEGEIPGGEGMPEAGAPEPGATPPTGGLPPPEQGVV